MSRGSLSGRGGSRGSFRGNSRGMGRSFDRRGSSNYGPPAEIIEVGLFLHPCENALVCKLSLNQRIPYFNAPIFLENKQEIGQIDEIFGPIHEVYFSVICKDGIKADSFKADQKLFISSDKLLPLSRFVGDNAQPQRGGGRGRGGFGRGGGRGGFGRGGSFGRGGGRGGFRGGKGPSRGFSRGR